VGGASPSSDPNLVLCTGAVPGRGFRETVAAAASSGHGGISMTVRFLMRAVVKENISFAEMPEILQAHGVRAAAVETGSDWLPGTDPGARAEAPPLAELVTLAQQLNAPVLTVLSGVRKLPPTREVARAFAEICRAGADAGLAVAIEPVAFMALRDTGLALEVIERADQPNGGLVLDSWHHARSGSRDADLARIPRDRIMAIQLVDAPANGAGDIRQECFFGRLLPGDGDLDLTGFLNRLQGRGQGVPTGVETWSEALHRKDIAAAADILAARTRAVQAAAWGGLPLCAPTS